ncbi:MAG: DNA repair protein RadC [Halanaerobiales bacterium]|nr:DNA repair protein RadC [Halanaerobiales bacterium]
MGKNAHFRITDLPIEERPREKLVKFGPENLSNSELLAIILRIGTRNQTAIGLAEKLLGYVNGLKGLLDVSVEELMNIQGIGQAKAVHLVALGELTKRVQSAQHTKKRIHSATELVELLMPKMRFLKKEVFWIVLLDNQNQILAIEEVSRGSVNETIVHPREVFREAIRRSSSAVILAHNHPSGNPEPSYQDLEVTRRLCQSGKILGIQILDHLILGDKQYISLKERGII